jgi:hypothetical protein
MYTLLRSLVLVWILSLPARAAQRDSSRTDSLKRAYIQSYKDYIKVRLSLNNNYTSFQLTDASSGLDFTLLPNERLRSTLTLMYSFAEIDIGYTPLFLRMNQDNDAKGKSRYGGLGGRFYLGQWIQYAQYSSTKGFYIDKNDLGTAQHVLFPHLKVWRIGGGTSYNFNPRFSFKAINIQSEGQRKSAGSFMPALNYYYSEISDSLPGKDHSYNIAAGPAYFYNWVIARHFILSGGAYIGLGYNYTRTTYSNGRASEVADGLMAQAQFRINLGYNSRHIYAGICSRAEVSSYTAAPQLQLNDQNQFFEVYIGYRFLCPPLIKRLFEAVPILGKS